MSPVKIYILLKVRRIDTLNMAIRMAWICERLIRSRYVGIVDQLSAFWALPMMNVLSTPITSVQIRTCKTARPAVRQCSSRRLSGASTGRCPPTAPCRHAQARWAIGSPLLAGRGCLWRRPGPASRRGCCHPCGRSCQALRKHRTTSYTKAGRTSPLPAVQHTTDTSRACFPVSFWW